VRRTRRFSVIVGLVLLAIAAGRTGFAATKPQLEIEAPPALLGAATELRWSTQDWDGVTALVGLEDAGAPIHVLLVPEEDPRAQRTPRWITGFAVAERDTVVLLPGRVLSYPHDSLGALLTHEVTHVLLARAAGGQALPRWFQEGVALLAAREWQFEDRERLLLGGITGVPPSMASLQRAFDGDGYSIETAYAIAGALVQELVREHGREVVARIAAEVARGEPFAAAFRAATGDSLGDFQAGFWRRFRWRYRWVPFLTSGATLWLGVTALALVAMARRRQRDAAIRARWDEEERLATAAALRAATVAAAAADEADDEGLVSPYGPH
jgi:hypothetical protein